MDVYDHFGLIGLVEGRAFVSCVRGQGRHNVFLWQFLQSHVTDWACSEEKMSSTIVKTASKHIFIMSYKMSIHEYRQLEIVENCIFFVRKSLMYV